VGCPPHTGCQFWPEGCCWRPAACCLLLFTLIGSNLIERIGWLKPMAGVALMVIGAKLVFDYVRS
jgi:hypothetical protein